MLTPSEVAKLAQQSVDDLNKIRSLEHERDELKAERDAARAELARFTDPTPVTEEAAKEMGVRVLLGFGYVPECNDIGIGKMNGADFVKTVGQLYCLLRWLGVKS